MELEEKKLKRESSERRGQSEQAINAMSFPDENALARCLQCASR